MSDAKKDILKCISEESYESEMLNTVEPYLKEKRLADEYFNSFDSSKIHYEAYVLPESKGSIIVSHGFTESAEKFREMSYYFLRAGYNVFVIEHRGHGLSHRDVDDVSLTHIDKFDIYVKDLCTFINDVVKPASGDLPLYLYAHSMGGAIATLYLQRHPGVIKKAVLSAPMICPNTGYPIWFTKLVMGFFIAIAKSNKMVFFMHGFNPDEKFENSHDTSKARFEYYRSKRINNKFLQNYSPSYKWVWESVRIVKIMLSNENCRRIDAKVLLFQAEEDRAVALLPQNKFISKLNDGRLEVVPGSKHEIFFSSNEVLEGYLTKIFDFLSE